MLDSERGGGLGERVRVVSGAEGGLFGMDWVCVDRLPWFGRK
jgi:hypothetical protein